MTDEQVEVIARAIAWIDRINLDHEPKFRVAVYKRYARAAINAYEATLDDTRKGAEAEQLRICRLVLAYVEAHPEHVDAVQAILKEIQPTEEGQ